MKKKERLKVRLTNKYRLVVLSEKTFEEKVSFKLNRLNVLFLAMFFTFSIITFTIALIAYTSLKEYIPGYEYKAIATEAKQLAIRTDSINNVMAYNQRYYEVVKKLLSGDEIFESTYNKDSLTKEIRTKISEEDLQPSEVELLLRKEVADKERFSLDATNAEIEDDFLLVAPVKGTVTSTFNYPLGHYAIDIAVEKDTPVKAAAAGIIIFSEWTQQTGYVLIIKHSSGLVSVYKHNKKLMVKQADLVDAGEVIAFAGNTGELTTGTHLHFELWYKNSSLNPEDYIDFKK